MRLLQTSFKAGIELAIIVCKLCQSGNIETSHETACKCLINKTLKDDMISISGGIVGCQFLSGVAFSVSHIRYNPFLTTIVILSYIERKEDL
jgi:hypothetical protein